jgi:hypothetical protein
MAKARRTSSRTVTLKIPAELYENLGRLIEGTGFRSVTEFAIHVLRDVAAGGRLREERSELTAQEIEAVRKRLRALGYIE